MFYFSNIPNKEKILSSPRSILYIVYSTTQMAGLKRNALDQQQENTFT